MKLQRELHIGLAGCMLALWICAPLRAQQPAPELEVVAPPAAFSNGPLPPHVAQQVRAIVAAQVKGFLPPAEKGAVEIDRLDKDTILTATVGGHKYSGKVFRSFLVEPLDPNEFGAMKEYYVRTTAPWPLKAGLVIPADTYLSGMVERASAYNADVIATQDAAIARSEVLCKGALSQVGPQRKARQTAINDAHKAETESLTKQITQLNTDIGRKEKAREAIEAQIARNPPKAPQTRRGPDNTIAWQWTPGEGLSFNDGLEQSRQELDEAITQEKTLEATKEAELAASVGQLGTRETAIRAIFQKHRRRILAGEMVPEEEMRADYESALGEPLKEPPPFAKPLPLKPADGKGPIQTVPAPKRGT